MNKREFLKGLILFFPAGGVLAALAGELDATETAGKQAESKAGATGAKAPEGTTGAAPEHKDYDAASHYYGMGIEVDKCIGCSRCVEACKAENDVPREPFFFRTWIERYVIKKDGDVTVESINVRGKNAKDTVQDDPDVLRTFFVPKLCNHCAQSPCEQVCPVGATFRSPDGVVLVDKERCLGCRYCVQACPYGCRYIDPRTNTVDKCTLCYHRITKGLLPACVEVCPTGARMLGDLKNPADPIHEFLRVHKVQVLKPQMATGPKVYYAGLDASVR